MSLSALLLIALGLSMDSLTVALACGIALRLPRLRSALVMALFFGAFQALMPILGWLAGLSFRAAIASFEHWLACGLLVAVGGKMVWESFRPRAAQSAPVGLGLLVLLSLATSIDALAVGLSLSFLRVPIIGPALLIGAVTFSLSLLAGLIGCRIKKEGCAARLELLGGLMLIGLGLKILCDHGGW